MKDDLRPGPARVQIQTQSACNGRCVFCPNEAVRRSDLPQGRMDADLFCKIVDELAETQARRISLVKSNSGYQISANSSVSSLASAPA